MEAPKVNGVFVGFSKTTEVLKNTCARFFRKDEKSTGTTMDLGLCGPT